MFRKMQCLIHDCYVKHVILTHMSFTRLQRGYTVREIGASKGLLRGKNTYVTRTCIVREIMTKNIVSGS